MTVVTLSATETTILTAGHGNRVRDGSGSLRPVSGIARGKGFRVPQQNAMVHADPWSSEKCRLKSVGALPRADAQAAIANLTR
jgi:hypothetical protein